MSNGYWYSKWSDVLASCYLAACRILSTESLIKKKNNITSFSLANIQVLELEADPSLLVGDGAFMKGFNKSRDEVTALASLPAHGIQQSYFPAAPFMM